MSTVINRERVLGSGGSPTFAAFDRKAFSASREEILGKNSVREGKQ